MKRNKLPTKKSLTRILSFLLTILLILPIIFTMTIPVSAADPNYRAIEPGGATTPATAPDGQPAYKVGFGDGFRFTDDGLGLNLSAYVGQYFVFDVWTGGANMPVTGDLAVIPTGSNSSWWGVGARFVSVSKTVNAGSNWMTFYMPLASMRTESGNNDGFTPAVILGNLRQLGFNLNAGGWVGDFLVRNARFQNNQNSPKPVPTVVGTPGATVDVKATAPANGQAVEFAINNTGAAPTSWILGTLNGSDYIITFNAPASDTYYIYARAVQNSEYIEGTYSRTTVTSKSDQQLVDEAAASLSWNTIRNANTNQNDVTSNLTLPNTLGTTSVSWVSSNTAAISNVGVVNRLADRNNNKTINLTATITKGGASAQKTITVTVLAVPMATDALVQPFGNGNVSGATVDGQPAFKLNIPAVIGSSHYMEVVTSPVQANLLGYADQYFVFDMRVTDANLLRLTTGTGNNWFCIRTVGGGGTYDDGARFNFPVNSIRAQAANTWFTVAIPITTANAGPGGFNLANLGNVTGIRLQMQWENGVNPQTAGDIYIKNTRFQNNANSPRPVPAVDSKTSDSITVSAINPGNGQSVEFAISTSGAEPVSGWVDGILGTNYTYTFNALTSSEQYYIFARAKANAQYNFSGVSARISETVDMSDEQAVALAKTELTWAVIANENASVNDVRTDLILPKTGANNTVISWASSNINVISNDGAVNRQIANTSVTLTATISKGDEMDTVIFNLTVTGGMTDAAAVALTKNWLTWDVIKGVNETSSNVTANLYLPITGEDGTAISWVSSNTTIMSIANPPSNNFRIGSIAANRSSDGGATFNVTATITKGAVTDTKVFALTIPDRNDWAKHIKFAPGDDKYDTKEWTTSDFNVLGFGAMTQEMIAALPIEEQAKYADFCNREAFQKAIDAAYQNGGGVVYAPEGTYAFRTDTTQSQTSKGVTYYYRQVLNLRSGVQIRGDWVDPDTNGGKVEGTILAVYTGHNTPRFNLYVPSDAYESQTGSGRLDNVDDRFIHMVRGTGVTNLSVWYPNQDINSVVPYPWTFYQKSGDSATIDRITLVNAYGGFISLPSELHYALNSRMTVLNTGVRVHTCTDIGRVEGVKIDPKYWANSGLPGSPSVAEVRAYTREYATGFEMHRSDWEYVANFSVVGCKTGMWVGREPGFSETPNAQLYGLYFDDCKTGLDIEAVNSYGLLISNSKIGGDAAVSFSSLFSTSVQFNGVDFKGPIVSNAPGGVISFEACTFDQYGGYALNLNRGNVLIGQCDFKQPYNHVYLGSGFSTFKSVNSGYNLNLNNLENLNLDVTKVSAATSVTITNDKEYIFEPIPKDIKTDIDVYPKPASKAVLRVDLRRENGYDNNTPANDISAQLQDALNYIKDNYGSGTLYLPAGRYRVNSPIIVPEGVEIKGTWDVQHHTEGGGTAIFTSYTGSTGGLGDSLIQLKKDAGIRGLNIVQLGYTSNTNLTGTRTPFLIQGQGTGVYAINISIPIGDKGIDLASYNTSGHYVDYLGGSLLSAGIWVGGGVKGGFIRNMQFNPHYTGRRPEGTQGYPAAPSNLYSHIQGNASALKFADVEGETIFNNFVYGSINGIHFLKDTITGKYPGNITVIGHGSDGCTFAFAVEHADANTKIIGINSELVNTVIAGQSVRSYVRMGFSAAADVDPDAQVILYNSAFWGSPTTGALVYNGSVKYHQANFSAMGAPGISIYGGTAHIYNSYFRSAGGSGNNVHAYLYSTGKGLELTNNFYSGDMAYVSQVPFGVYGSDISLNPFVFGLSGTGPAKTLTVTYNIRGISLPGKIRLLSPSMYAGDFTPVPFGALYQGTSFSIDLPYYSAGLLKFEIELTNGKKYTGTVKYDTAYAENIESESAQGVSTPPLTMDISEYVRANTGPLKWDGPQDLSEETRFAWDANNLYVYTVVTDREHWNSQTVAGNIWDGDCLQVGVDLSAAKNRLNELGFALGNDNIIRRNAWTRATGTLQAISNMGVNVVRDSTVNTTIYDLKIPYNTIHANPIPALANMTRIGVSIFINDAFDGARRQELEVVSSHLKNSALFTDLYLLDAGEYANMIEASAIAAVNKALVSESAMNIAMAFNFISLMPDGDLKNELKAMITPVTFVSATPSAYVTKLTGNQNDLTITVTELYSDGSTVTIKRTIKINNNAAGTYEVGDYKVYVDTKGNDQIRACHFVD